MFVGERNESELPKLTIVRAWQRARAVAFTPRWQRHHSAGLPTTCGTPPCRRGSTGAYHPTTVAAWAGHSVEILLKTYAKCLDGTDAVIRQRVQAALGQTSR